MTGIVIIYECPEKTKRKEGGKMEDAQIIDLIYDRSEQGLSELDGKYRKLLMSVTSGILRCNEDAEECVSDAYVKVWNVFPLTDRSIWELSFAK